MKAAETWKEINAKSMAEAALILGLQAWEKLFAVYPKTDLPFADAYRLFVNRAEVASSQNMQDVAFTCIKTASEYLSHLPSNQVSLSSSL